MIQFIVNETLRQSNSSAGTVLLDLLRNELGLKGSKEGCREGDCGACTVLVGKQTNGGMQYKTVASCLLPIGDLQGKHVVTIEGLNRDGLSAVQQAMVDQGATQCGFCTPGIVVALTGFLINSKTLGIEDAFAAIEGNICRCTGYISIRRACEQLISQINLSVTPSDKRIQALVNAELLPIYFTEIPSRLNDITSHPFNCKNETSSVLVAGGTDLFVQKPDILLNRKLDFISDNADLQQIRLADGWVEIGAAATVEALKHNAMLCESLSAWNRALELVSSTLIRNRATVAGNLINASPIGDITIMLLALGATLLIESSKGKRLVSLNSFYRGYKKFDLQDGERVISIKFPVPRNSIFFNFEKVSRREHLDIASVNSAICLNVSDDVIVQANLSAGGVAPIPLYLDKSSSWLEGKLISQQTVQQLVEIADSEIAPIDDVRGTAEYKRRLLRRLVIAHFVTCFPRYEWEGLN